MKLPTLAAGGDQTKFPPRQTYPDFFSTLSLNVKLFSCQKKLTEFRNLLIIDDNESIHDDFRKIFAAPIDRNGLDELDTELFGMGLEKYTPIVKPEYGLSFASQGKEGFEILKKSLESNVRFGVAFVDMRMPPGWDGVETIENLWKLDPDLQIVICTAFSDRSWNEIIERLGFTDQLLILKKPFDEIEVVQIAAAMTNKRCLLAESKKRVKQLENVVVNRNAELTVAHKDAELLISSISSLLISLDENGVVSRWNPAAHTLLEIPAFQAVGEKFISLPIDWADPVELSNSMDECAVVQEIRLECQFRDRSGTTRTLDMKIYPVRKDTTNNARLILASDITTQKSLQAQLDQINGVRTASAIPAVVPIQSTPANPV